VGLWVANYERGFLKMFVLVDTPKRLHCTLWVCVDTSMWREWCGREDLLLKLVAAEALPLNLASVITMLVL